MDSSNYNDIRRLAVDDSERDKVRLILNESHPGRNGNVPDPYWDDDGFDKVYHMLKEACEKMVNRYG